jgi:hypothetical protein
MSLVSEQFQVLIIQAMDGWSSHSHLTTHGTGAEIFRPAANVLASGNSMIRQKKKVGDTDHSTCV